MDNFSQKVKVFDAFPKTAPEHSVRSSRGGFSSLLTIFAALFIVWVHIGGFLGGFVDRQFSVDKSIRLDLMINVDMIVAMPCQHLTTNVMDITSDNLLAEEVLNFQGMGFFVPPYFNINNENSFHLTPQIDQVMQDSLRAEYAIKGQHFDVEKPACHIFGQIPVNHVKGQFFVVPRGSLYYDHLYVPAEAYNMSHSIFEFSYGDFLPYLDNPLDFTAKITDDSRQLFNYYAKVVPTLFEKIGLVVETYQYSLTEIHRRAKNGRGNAPPGIYFTYSFEPIKLSIREKRISFFLFIAKLATIVSGLFIVAGYAYRLYERVLMVLFGKRYVERSREKKDGGLLDGETPESKDH